MYTKIYLVANYLRIVANHSRIVTHEYNKIKFTVHLLRQIDIPLGSFWNNVSKQTGKSKLF